MAWWACATVNCLRMKLVRAGRTTSRAPTAGGRAAHAGGRLEPDRGLTATTETEAHAEGLRLVWLKLPKPNCGQTFRDEELKCHNGGNLGLTAAQAVADVVLGPWQSARLRLNTKPNV